MVFTDNVLNADGALIVGAGLAGLFCALKLAPRPVTVISPKPLGNGTSSAWAQGGVAAAVGEGDSPHDHAVDTEIAGAGIVDHDEAESVAAEAAARIEDLARWGTPFDRDELGHYLLSKEAAHSRNRVVRVAGDRAGYAIMQAIIAEVRKTPSIRVVEGLTVVDLARADGRIIGVYARKLGDRYAEPVLVRARATVLAAGGLGGLYAVTTNPPGVRGHAMGMAARAGAVIADPEFVQFHPTAIATGADPAPLATEALRGEGAILVNDLGERFMPAIHPDAELAPRDIVARANYRQIKAGRRVFLDTRQAIGARILTAFPTVAKYCTDFGIDPVNQLIPVTPAAHYHMGGVWTDEHGRTSLEGLYAVGECAATGVHGANRLASNSLLEAAVFGLRAGRAARAEHDPGTAVLPPAPPPELPAQALPALRRSMSLNAGVERTAEGLERLLGEIAALIARYGEALVLTTARLIAQAALDRRESRGGHWRLDFPEADAEARRTFVSLETAVREAAE